MKKINQSGFSIVEAMFAVIILAAVAGAGWIAYRDHHKTASTGNAAKSTMIATKASTSACPSLMNVAQVPNGWKTYTSSQYNYSISYPSTWYVTSGSGGTTPEGLPILDDNGFMPPQNQGPMYDLNVTKQSLSSAISTFESRIKTANYNGGLSGGPIETILSNTACSYEGHPAAEIVTKDDTKSSLGTEYDIEIYVSANNYLYDFSADDWVSPTLSNITDASVGDVLSVAESLQIK